MSDPKPLGDIDGPRFAHGLVQIGDELDIVFGQFGLMDVANPLVIGSSLLGVRQFDAGVRLPSLMRSVVPAPIGCLNPEAEAMRCGVD